ncbi:WSC domain-containing protein 1-like 2 [Homarus americanus]|uniref:WSC domain-containing protein 1-like 2 n=1 Tax=Homarus americanus TaxID=6706 RepID=A0A8J5K4I5_HOMAM|nr:WSC domain-containing protein 1-like 2 [Homarus americanus]
MGSPQHLGNAVRRQHQQQSVSTPFEIFNTSQDEIHHESLSRIYELSLEGGDVLEVNTTAPSWRLWDDDDPVDNPCVNYETRFGCGLVRVWLTSFPRSGNTWTRYLLEAATGIFTGSVFNDKTLYRSGFLGEIDRVDSGRTLVQKTHGLGLYSSGLRNLQERYDAASPNQPTILLLRNPARVPVDEGRMACVSSHPMGAFKRNNTKVNDPFTQEEKKMMSNTVSRITRLLFALGYPQPPVYEGLS